MDERGNLTHDLDHFIKISEKRLDKSSIVDTSSDYSINGDKLNPGDFLYLASTHEFQEQIFDGNGQVITVGKPFGQEFPRLRTEGRSLSMSPGKIKEVKTGETYNDILIKGIGGLIRPLTMTKAGEKEPIQHFQKGKRKIYPRFIKGDVNEITGEDFGSLMYDASDLDASMSEELAEAG